MAGGQQLLEEKNRENNKAFYIFFFQYKFRYKRQHFCNGMYTNMENCVNGLLGVIYYTDTRPEAIIVYSPHVYHNYIIICILLLYLC
jgi:hypothetical protein